MVLFKDEEFIPFQYLNGRSEHSHKVDCFVPRTQADKLSFKELERKK